MTKYRNPYFRKQAPRRRRLLIPIAVFLLVAGLLVGIFAAPFFKIKSVIVENAPETLLPQVQTSADGFVTSSKILWRIPANMITMRAGKLADSLAREFNFEDVVVTKNFSNQTLLIKIKLREPAFVVESGGSRGVVDKRGVVLDFFDESPSSTPRLPLVLIRTTSTIESRATLFDSTHTAALLRVTGLLSSGEVPGGLARVEIDAPGAQNLTAYTSEGWRINYSVQADIETQISNLKLTLAKITDRSQLQYIDLRFGDKVYYK